MSHPESSGSRVVVRAKKCASQNFFVRSENVEQTNAIGSYISTR